MHRFFSDWYRIVEFNITDEIYKKRENAVKKIISDLDEESLLKLISILFGFSTDEALYNTFIAYFRDEDNLFKSINNDFEIRILAGCVLASLIVDGDIDENYKDLISLAVLTTFFENNCRPCPLSGFIEEFNKYLWNRSRELRIIKKPEELRVQKLEFQENVSNNWSQAAAQFDLLKKSNNYLINKINDNQQRLIESFQIFSEELNVCWWIIGGSSNLLKKEFSKLKSSSPEIILAKELANFTEFNVFPPVFDSILRKVLSMVGVKYSGKQVFAEMINNVPEKEIFLIKDRYIINYCPIHYALNKAIESDDNSSWLAPVKKMFNMNPNALIECGSLTKQFYLESLLIKLDSKMQG